jgi:hypothetical protein
MLIRSSAKNESASTFEDDPSGLDEMADFLFGMGTVRGLLGPLDEGQWASDIAEVRDEFEQTHDDGVGVRLGGVWLVSAQAGCQREVGAAPIVGGEVTQPLPSVAGVAGPVHERPRTRRVALSA